MAVPPERFVIPRPDRIRTAVSIAERPHPRGLRMLTESLVLLALAVTLCRWSAVEGYMISTGSMATSLLGYHRRVVCPACGFEFAVGAPGPPHFAAEVPGGEVFAQEIAVAAAEDMTARCPNCDLGGIDLAPLPVTEGDQLLVHKDAYFWRELLRDEGPGRWEVAVFRNPENPALTYVKRIIGLPGEVIELIHGDVYADGGLQRKPFDRQLGTRILIHANDYEPTGRPGPDWEPRWLIDGLDSPWEWAAPTFVLNTADSSADSSGGAYEWVRYEHWIRQGGTHTTTVDLDRWPETVPQPDPYLSTVEYDAEERRVSCFGVLPTALRERWTMLADDEGFARTLQRLHRLSHVAPITDRMGYNVGVARDSPSFVTDFMLELTIEGVRGAGSFAIELTDGTDVFIGEFDFGAGEVRLWVAGEDEPRAARALPAGNREEAIVVQMSTFDRQVVLAVNDEPLFEPIELEASSGPVAGVSRPARFGARQLDVRVNHIRLFRDVYYTSATSSQRFEVGPDGYFVLGDNSSVSVDSRHWEQPGVHRDLLVGKPLLVHLPSRSRQLNWGGGRRYIRVPDFSRIRYIR